MRVLVFIMIVAVLVIIGGIATGLLNISQVRSGEVPRVAATSNGITAQGGRAPAFDVATGSVKVGTKATTVKVPTLVVQKPAGSQNQVAANSAM